MIGKHSSNGPIWAAPRARRAAASVIVLAAMVGAPPASGSTVILGSYGASVRARTASFWGQTNQFSGLPAQLNIPYVTGVLESSPAGVASATVIDSGPLGQAGVATMNQYAEQYSAPPELRAMQPQYAIARYPGNSAATSQSSVGGSDPSGAGSVEAGSAVAKAAENRVEARAQAAGGSMRAPDGMPAAPGSESSPYAVRAAHLESIGRIEVGSDGLMAEATSSAAGVEVAGGLIHFDVVKSIARAFVDGKAGKTPVIDTQLVVTGATIGGVPVVVGPDGPVVAANAIPGGADGLRQAREQLRSALEPAQMSVEVVASSRRATPSPGAGRSADVHVVAGGLRITWSTPVPKESVPRQDFVVVLGGADIDAHVESAIPAEHRNLSFSGGAGLSPGPGVGGSSVLSNEFSSGLGSDSAPSSLGTVSGGAGGSRLEQLVAARRRTGGSLLAMFVLWQVVVACVLVQAARRRRPGKTVAGW